MLKTVALSSLERVFPNGNFEEKTFKSISAMKNEPVSFQVAYKLFDSADLSIPVNVKVETDLPVSLFAVGCVPVLHTSVAGEDFAKAGLFPDVLYEKKINPEYIEGHSPTRTIFTEKGDRTQLNATVDSWQSVWLTVNEKAKTIKSGRYKVKVSFLDRRSTEVMSESEVTVDIIDASLAKQKICYTNWIHCDNICEMHGVEMFSDRFFELLGDYLKLASQNGMNMVLVPAFTPALDTPIGQYRMKAQLVGIEKKGSKYNFDFSLMKRYIDVAKKSGITHFEHTHFFTQWGAIAAPMIFANVNGKEKRIFGWDTDSTGKAYGNFLKQYIPAVIEFLKQEKLDKRILFHVSDEPTEKNFDNYRKACDVVRPLLEGYLTGDALSKYEFYSEGVTKCPIVRTDSVHGYIGRCDYMWCYYTGGEVKNGLSNRTLAIPPEKNRMIGIQMYYFNMRGFLHWGYNFYYDRLSQGFFEPRANPCGFNNNPATAFMVYPEYSGKINQSTRQKVFGEGLLDIRALQLLEKLTSKENCHKIIEKHFGEMSFHASPSTPEQMLAFREEVNAEIAKNI